MKQLDTYLAFGPYTASVEFTFSAIKGIKNLCKKYNWTDSTFSISLHGDRNEFIVET